MMMKMVMKWTSMRGAEPRVGGFFLPVGKHWSQRGEHCLLIIIIICILQPGYPHIISAKFAGLKTPSHVSNRQHLHDPPFPL